MILSEIKDGLMNGGFTRMRGGDPEDDAFNDGVLLFYPHARG